MQILIIVMKGTLTLFIDVTFMRNMVNEDHKLSFNLYVKSQWLTWKLTSGGVKILRALNSNNYYWNIFIGHS